MLSHRDPETQKQYDEYQLSYAGDCVFCDPAEREFNQPVAVHEYFSIIPNRFPYKIWDGLSVTGHYLIIPNRHITHFTEFTADEAKEFFRLVTDYEADGYSLYSRAPTNTSRTVSHHHTHLIKLDTNT